MPRGMAVGAAVVLDVTVVNDEDANFGPTRILVYCVTGAKL